NDRGDDSAERVAERRARNLERGALLRAVVRRALTVPATSLAGVAAAPARAAIPAGAAPPARRVPHPLVLLGQVPPASLRKAGAALRGSRSDIAQGCFAAGEIMLRVLAEPFLCAESAAERGLERFGRREIGLRTLGLLIELPKQHVVGGDGIWLRLGV